MLLKKQGFPEEGEFVLCTVTGVHHNSVFANLDEYNKTGLIHISEISPGRIRNIRDYVVEGKKIVCLVLRIDDQKGHIDLSLRRVNDNQKRNKIDQIKQEQKAEKIVEYIAKKLDIGLTMFYKEIYNKVPKEYSYLSSFFTDVALGQAKIEKLGLSKERADLLKEIIIDRIKPSEAVINLKLGLKSYSSDGVDIIKDVLNKSSAIAPDIIIKYEGGGSYNVKIKAEDYKKADKISEKFRDKVTKLMGKNNGEAKVISKK